MSKTQSPKSDFQTQSFNVRTNADLEVWTSDFGLYYESHGVGAALILIPGFASGTWTWFRQTDELSRDFRVITFDPRGIGKSKTDKNDLQNLSMKTFVSDVLGLLDFLKIEKAHILGASFGGFVALEFALSFPERVNKLILACTTAGGEHHVAPDIEILRSFTPDVNLPLGTRIRKFFRPAFTAEFNVEHAEVVEKVCRLREENEVADAAYSAQLETAFTFDLENKLGAIKHKTLIITGDRDNLVPMQNSINLAEKLPNSILKIIENGSHMIFIENAKKFNQTITNFLNGEGV